MKIPVKIVEVVEVRTLVEKVVEKDIKLPDTITKDNEYFQDMIDYLKTLEFVGTSCVHRDFESFISWDQGGNNTTDLALISVLYNDFNKLTIEVRWKGYKHPSDGAIVIFKLPKKD